MESLTGFTLRLGEASERSRALLERTSPSLFGVPGSGQLGKSKLLGSPHVWARPLTVIPDDQVTALGSVAGVSGIGLAMKVFPTWTSVYTMNPVLPPEVWRAIARRAGVHVYNKRNDTLYANSRYLCVNADGPGERVLKFKKPLSALDLTRTEARPTEATQLLRKHLRNGETALWRLTEEA